MDSFIVTDVIFYPKEEKKKNYPIDLFEQPLTLAPPSAAATELQVISHASLLWA